MSGCAHTVEELDDPARQIKLTGEDIKLLNPNTRTCPIFRTRRDAELTKAIYRRVPILIDKNRKGPTGNPWDVDFKTMFHQTNDADLFREADVMQAEGLTLEGNCWTGKDVTYLPVYEAKMLQAYDHRAADVVTTGSNWVRQGQTSERTLVDYQNPEHLAMPRYWVAEKEVELPSPGTLGFKDITSPTNRRTMIASWASYAGFTNHFIVVQPEVELRTQLCLLANLGAFPLDYCVRQKIGGVTLNFFIVEQIPVPPPRTSTPNPVCETTANLNSVARMTSSTGFGPFGLAVRISPGRMDDRRSGPPTTSILGRVGHLSSDTRYGHSTLRSLVAPPLLFGYGGVRSTKHP